MILKTLGGREHSLVGRTDDSHDEGTMQSLKHKGNMVSYIQQR